MGQKVNPIGMRLGINKNWDSRWYADKKEYPKVLQKDIKIRNFLDEKLQDASIGRVEIEMTDAKTEVIIHTSKPGIIIGRKGEALKQLSKDLEKITGGRVQISIKDVKNPNIDATIIAKNIAKQIENRVSYRIAQKRAIQNAMRSGAKGIKTLTSGRLNGVEMARSEGYSEGSTPLHTLRADIDYASVGADTQYGKIGVKVWVYKGEVLDIPEETETPERRPNKRRPKKEGGDKNVNAIKDKVSQGS